jgi:hypothetical protein
MIIGLPQSMIIEVSRACRAIMPVTRQLLDELGFDGEIARKGVPAPIQAGTRWVVERTHSCMNGYGKLRRCTERDARAVDFYLYLGCVRHYQAADPACPQALSLGYPADYQAPQVTQLPGPDISYRRGLRGLTSR